MIDRIIPDWLVTEAGRGDLVLILAFLAFVVPSVILPLIVFIKRRRNPLRAWYLPFRHGEGDATRARLKSLTVNAGSVEIYIRVEPRRGTHFGTVDVRCVERNWAAWGRKRNVSPNIIEIVEARDYLFEREDRRVPTRSDGRGGLNLVYDPVYLCPKGEALSLTVQIKANRVWCGYIGIRNMFGDAERLGVHLPLRVLATTPERLAP